MECKITFNLDGGKSLTAPARTGETLLAIAKSAGLAIDAPCSGNGTCGKCRVQLLSGSADSPESRHINPEEFAAGYRLACSTKAVGDAAVYVPATALAYQNRMKVTDLGTGREREVFAGFQQELRDLGLAGDTGLELLSVSLSEPSLDDAMADKERLLLALAGQIEGTIAFSLYAQRRLPLTLRESPEKFSCIVLIRREKDSAQGCTILDFFPANTKPVLPGLAIDIGTTSVSILLADLQTGEPLAVGNAGNGQIRYGADVINRIIESTKPGGLDRLYRAVIGDCIAPLVQGLCEKAGVEPERVYRAAIAGNTTMTHLFLKTPPEYLRLEPYIPAFFDAGDLRGSDIGIGIHPDAAVTIAPAVGSYVGGDITAGAFSSMIFKKESLSLLVDLGTNGELVFGSSEFLMSCACSAGPAFEGGDISCGMRATDGAVEAVEINEETMEPKLSVIGGGKPAGLCGSGLIDTIGELFRCGVINAKGKVSREGKRVRRDEYGQGCYVIAFAQDSESGRDLVLTETDIDSFIRAKGAIFSAIRTMLTMLDFPMDAIENVYVAGGIGSGINIKQAIAIGMFPNISLDQYHYIGNSSLSGAYAMLTSRKAADMVDGIGKSMTYLELSSHPSYMDEFVAACFLPHTDASLFQ
ncbi:MAG: ASKHA domain-containing protein [Spirochaetaceae bacterium]|jgi:uncharacterized 2Fe-2S/4Fe-4S cluster protein (DUF4445 family)|nr:ASKHA domain-containing protein [Spirochaetaceae bacterium]